MDDSFSFGMQSGSFECSDFWDTLTSRFYLQPEKMLMLAILEDAWFAFEKHLPRPDKRFREEVQWFLDDGAERFFSFQNICDVLRLDAGYIRQQLLRRLVKQSMVSDNYPTPSGAGPSDFVACGLWETRRPARSKKPAISEPKDTAST